MTAACTIKPTVEDTTQPPDAGTTKPTGLITSYLLFANKPHQAYCANC